MNYETAYWLLDLCSERYLSTRHMALQVEAANFIANYDLEKWDADCLREAAESLGLDIRTLKRYAAYNEAADGSWGEQSTGI